MSEITMPEALSGEEIINAVLFKLRKKLENDCFLNPCSAYESFDGQVVIHLRMHDLGRTPEVSAEVLLKLGKEVGLDMAAIEADMTFEQEPPNIVRQDTEQGVPTLVETGDGKKDIKHVRYAPRKKNAEVEKQPA